MAESRKPGPTNPPMGSCLVPARTCGPLGYLDQGDPTVTTLLGDTPGPLGHNDWATPAIADYNQLPIRLAGGICRADDGTPLSLGSSQSAIQGVKQATNTTLNWDEVQADFARWEGKITHMYLDTKGLVTVGIGKMLPNVAAAQALGFVRRSDKATATATEIETDFKEVSKQTKGKLASSYEKYTKLDLPDDAIFDLLKSVVDGFEADLENNFVGYKTYPVAAKRALLDMIYNLGLGGLLKFKKLKASVEAGDWKKAAEDCHRTGPSDERNDWTRDLFLEAGK
jgi:GH24 family phage-related lysozyme (muramidase)